MKDFIIDVVTTASQHAAAVVAQSSGTLSARPVVNKTLRRTTPAEAAFTGLIASLQDLSGFLNEGDHVDAMLHCTNGPTQDWITKGSGNKQLDAQMRSIVHSYTGKGISVSLAPAKTERRDLAQKAAMSLSMGV